MDQVVRRHGCLSYTHHMSMSEWAKKADEMAGKQGQKILTPQASHLAGKVGEKASNPGNPYKVKKGS